MSSSLASDKKVKTETINSQRLFVKETGSVTSKGNRSGVPNTLIPSMNSTSFTISNYSFGSQTTTNVEPNQMQPSSSYVVTRMGRLESDLDHWMQGSSNSQDRRRQQPAAGCQQPNSESPTGTLSSLWYTLALLPMLSHHRRRPCNRENSIPPVVDAIELFATYLTQVASNVGRQVTLVTDQIFQSCFSVGMDVVLALHAFVFIVLAVYQAVMSVTS